MGRVCALERGSRSRPAGSGGGGHRPGRVVRRRPASADAAVHVARALCADLVGPGRRRLAVHAARVSVLSRVRDVVDCSGLSMDRDVGHRRVRASEDPPSGDAEIRRPRRRRHGGVGRVPRRTVPDLCRSASRRRSREHRNRLSQRLVLRRRLVRPNRHGERPGQDRPGADGRDARAHAGEHGLLADASARSGRDGRSELPARCLGIPEHTELRSRFPLPPRRAAPG